MPSSSPCPDPVSLGQLSRGIGDDESLAEFEAHLSTCETCSATFDVVSEDSDSCVRELARMPVRREDEDEFQRLYQQLLDHPEPFGTTIDDDISSRSTPLVDLPYRIAEYELFEILGRGAHGSVYKARHRKLDRLVAVKLLPKSSHEDDSQFLDEMRAIGRLDHPNIIRATDAGESGEWYYLAMEFQAGTDVSTLLRKHQRFPIADACEIARQTAMGLACVADHDLVHRDVKPSNLLLTDAGHVKLLDLGLASFQSSEKDTEANQRPQGTADYMSPEQWTDYASVDIRADMYSLGCTLYKLLVGYAPFQAVSNPNVRKVGQVEDAVVPHSLLSRRESHRTIMATPLRDIRAEVPESLERLVSRLLEKLPEDRIQSPRELAEQLSPYCASADLSSLAMESRIAGSSEFYNPDRAKRDKITRRLLLGTLAATASAVIASRFEWTRGDQGLQFGSWRALSPQMPFEPLRSLVQEDAVDWTNLKPANPGMSTPQFSSTEIHAADGPDRLLNLGQPVIGQFALKVLLTKLANSGRCGVFFRLRTQDSNEPEGSTSFQSIEWTDENESSIIWSSVSVEPSSAIRRTVFASVDIPVWRNETESVLEIRFGQSGFPRVRWGEKWLERSSWTISYEGRQQSAIPKRALLTENLGRIGLIAHATNVQFSEPKLCYLK